MPQDGQNNQPQKIQGARAKPNYSRIKPFVEACLFSADSPLKLTEIQSLVGDCSKEDVKFAILDLQGDYEERAFFIYSSGATYQLRTREEYSDILKKQFASRPKSLSRSAMETLAIIAYRQPITRAEINTIRQVDSSSIVNNLKDRGVIQVAGVRKEPGNPMEYRTTPKFLEVFGLDSLKQLPSLRSLQMSPEEQKDVTIALKELAHSENEANNTRVANQAVESMGMKEPNPEGDSAPPSSQSPEPEQET